MNTQKLNIKKSLKKCGAEKLSQLIGCDRLEAITSIMDGRIAESQMVEILISKHGSQILANKEIRTTLLRSLDKSSLSFLLYDEGDKEFDLTPEGLKKLESTPWKRNNTIIL